jgi:hypothetical protein
MENKDSSWVAFLPILEVLVGGEVGPFYHPLLHLNLEKLEKPLCGSPPLPVVEECLLDLFLRGLFG